jgi:hypothetical protein
MTTDPVLLDSLMLERINAVRKTQRLRPGDRRTMRRMLDFAQQLGVGSIDTKHVQWRRVDEGKVR